MLESEKYEHHPDRTVLLCILTLDTARDGAADEVTLEDQKHHQCRQRGHDRERHDLPPLPRSLTEEGLHGKWQP